MKFGQFLEYDMKHFSWKIIHKMCGETTPRPFSKKIKIEHISGSIVQNFTFFLLYAKLRAIEIYWN